VRATGESGAEVGGRQIAAAKTSPFWPIQAQRVVPVLRAGDKSVAPASVSRT
jgi:hypothetical protein